MDYRRLGESGLVVSAMGLGGNNFGKRLDERQTELVIERALDLGITLIDTADSYGHEPGASEVLVGRALRRRRHEAVLATKVGTALDDNPYHRGASRRWMVRAVEASLRRLGTDYIDLYQVHHPDPATPIGETLDTLDELVHQGKIRYFGHSNFRSWQIVEAHWTAIASQRLSAISTQQHYSLVNREPEMDILPACAACGVGLLAYFPLASGLLTGKYQGGAMPSGARLTGLPDLAQRFLTRTNLAIVDKLSEYAKSIGKTLIDLALGWVASRPQVSSVIVGASTPGHLETNVTSVSRGLDPCELREIERITSDVRT